MDRTVVDGAAGCGRVQQGAAVTTTHSEPQTVLLAYFKIAGRGWHGGTFDLEPALSFGNGAYRVTELFPKPGARF